MRARNRVLVSAVALSLSGALMAVAGPASAVVAPCLSNAGARSASSRGPGVPRWRHKADTEPVTKADLAALPERETRPGVVAREVTPRLPAHLVVPTFVHVIRGTHKGERNAVGPRRIRGLISILNNAMAGNQSEFSVPTRYRFKLVGTNYTRREGWYHAFFNGPRDRRMKHKLHRGNARTLNLYINGGGPDAYPVLGWSRFPWQYTSAPYLDGVSVNAVALPGGRAKGYNLGDTVVHETGHWLGLFHTFQGGCSTQGDLVSDTPAEAEPSFYCETTRDTCTAAGLDPVRNFMDYSLDACMDMLTRGQVRRIDTAFEKWRL